MNHRQDALAEIVDIARRNELTVGDVVDAMRSGAPEAVRDSGGIARRLLAYVGGIFVFAGLAVYIAAFWEDMNSAARIIVTLGSGVTALILAVLLTDRDGLARSATPLFMIAAWLQPTGVLVAFDELGTGGDPQHAALAATTVMLLQQLLVMQRFRRPVLGFLALAFGTLTFGNAFDLMGLDQEVNAVIMGLSLLLLSHGIDRTRYRVITPFWYFLGGVAMLWGAFELLENTRVHVLYLGLAAFTIYASTVVRSRSLLFVATVAMIGYLGYFTAEYFADSTGWPVALIFMGLVLIGLSALALRINRKYIS